MYITSISLGWFGTLIAMFLSKLVYHGLIIWRQLFTVYFCQTIVVVILSLDLDELLQEFYMDVLLPVCGSSRLFAEVRKD